VGPTAPLVLHWRAKDTIVLSSGEKQSSRPLEGRTWWPTRLVEQRDAGQARTVASGGA